MAKTVTPHNEEFIPANIAGGRCNNASEARLAAFCAAIDEEAFLQELKAR